MGSYKFLLAAAHCIVREHTILLTVCPPLRVRCCAMARSQRQFFSAACYPRLCRIRRTAHVRGYALHGIDAPPTPRMRPRLAVASRAPLAHRSAPCSVAALAEAYTLSTVCLVPRQLSGAEIRARSTQFCSARLFAAVWRVCSRSAFSCFDSVNRRPRVTICLVMLARHAVPTARVGGDRWSCRNSVMELCVVIAHVSFNPFPLLL